MDKVRIGLVGAGAIAQVTHLPILKSLPEVELVAITDSNHKKAEWVARKYEVAHSYSDVEDMLRREDIDAVHICTPTDSHTPLAVAALSAGKHVLVEKPMARNYAEASEMVKAAREHNRFLMVAMNVRFRQDARSLHVFSENGELGEIFYAKAGWLRGKEQLVHRGWFAEKEISGGGVLMDLGIQMLDVCLWLMGEPEPITVKGATYNRVGKLQVEDSAAAFIGCRNGATITVEVSWTLLSEKDFFYTNIFGTQGAALLNPLRIHRELHGNLVNVTPTHSESMENLYKKSYEHEVKYFVECVRTDSPPTSSGEENLVRMRILDAIYQSAETGREVLL